jgi:hypothetical protein
MIDFDNVPDLVTSGANLMKDSKNSMKTQFLCFNLLKCFLEILEISLVSEFIYLSLRIIDP